MQSAIRTLNVGKQISGTTIENSRIVIKMIYDSIGDRSHPMTSP